MLAAPALAADATSGSVVPPTFARDVAPIFQEKCEACHRPDSIAPMSLVTYEEARPWARAIKTRVAARQMPPWHIDKTVGIQHFENDRVAHRRGDRHDRPLGRRRRAAGRSEGHAARRSSGRRETRGGLPRKFGQPDLVVKSPDYTMPAQAQDAWWKPVVDTGLTEPRWVRAIEIRPTTLKGRRITHHALARLKQDDGNDLAATQLVTSRVDDTEDVGPGSSWSGRSASRAR